MKTKQKISIGLLSLSLIGGFFGIANEVSASTFYHSTITLPRNGWWTTVDRVATSATATTKVNNPKYNVASRVRYGDGVTTRETTHYANKYDSHSHYHNVKGAKINGQFRSSIINQFTNRVYLGWQP